MEIERKWMVGGWAPGLTEKAEYRMEQGYLSVRPTVRIRREANVNGETDYVLCIKGKGRLAREEIEFSIEEDKYRRLEALIGQPLIPKQRRDYPLPDGLTLEVSRVDEGAPTEFWYAEVEFASVEQARAWKPESVGLGDYLTDDVTDLPGQSMGQYWLETRGPWNK